MCQLCEIVRVTERALILYSEVRDLELIGGATLADAERIAKESAMLHTRAELIRLLAVAE